MIKKVILIILFSYCILLSGCLAHKEKTNTNDLQEPSMILDMMLHCMILPRQMLYMICNLLN